MTNKEPTSSLMQRADEIAREKEAQSPENIETLSSKEIRWMFHELGVDRFELDLQKEELRAGTSTAMPTVTFPVVVGQLIMRVCLCISLMVFVCRAGGVESIFSETEKQWLTDHPVLSLGVRELPPLVMQLDGTNRFEGLGMDYVQMIERRLGIRFTLVHYPSWSQLLDAARNRDVDVLVTVSQTDERSRFLDFTPPYFTPKIQTNTASEAGANVFVDITNQYCFSSRNDWPQLGAILAKSLATVSATEHDTIRRRWITPYNWHSIRHPQGWVFGTAISGLLIFLMWNYYQRIGLFFKGSIRRNLILVVIISAMPSLGIILYGSLESRSAQIQVAKDQADQLAAQTANWVERLNRQTQLSLASLAQVPGLQSDDQKLESAFNSLLQSQRLLDIFVFNRRGEVVGAGRSELVGKINMSRLDITRQVIQHQCFAVGSLVMSVSYANPMIHFALPITHGQNDPNYFLGKTAQLDTWGIEFDRTRFPDGTSLSITDRRGLLLYRYPVQASASTLGQPILKSLWDEVSGLSVSGVMKCLGPDGTPLLLAYRQLNLDAIPSPDLYLLVSVPQTRMLAGTNWLLCRNFLLLMMAMMGAIVIAVFLGNRMLLNILDRIAVAARAIGDGKLSARVGSSASQKGELGELARTFDVMAANLERDEAERKRSEAEIKKLSSAVEQSPVIIFITDITGAIEYVNPSFTRITGYTMEEVRGQSPRVLKGDKTSAEEYQQLWECITHGREWRGEFHNRKKSGDFYWESASISPIVDAAGHIINFLAVKEDITQRKILEEQFRQVQKMDSIGQLAGGVAHDFNNILAVMMIRLNFMQNNKSLNHETQETVVELTVDAKRAASLTRQLLLFSRRSIMEVELLDLNELVANLLKMLIRLIGEHVTVRFDRGEDLPCVEADPVMLEQVIMNLSVNARDAMPQGGNLTMKIEPVQVDEEQVHGSVTVPPGIFLCLSVADTGCGMDEATLKRIFEPFFTTKEVGKGTGLGLATVHGIVAQHKGWVDVESELGKGTTFKVFLPATTKKKAEPNQTEKMEVVRGHETILLVEDEENLRQMVAKGLRRFGYSVLEADNGQTAMKLWLEYEQRIDLLFSDMRMPEGMTGLDLAERLKDDKPNLQVIISTGYSMEMDGQGSPTSGGIVYFQKPYEFEALLKIIRDCLDRA